MKFLNKIENDTFDVQEGHRHDGHTSSLIKGIDTKVVSDIDLNSFKLMSTVNYRLSSMKYVNGIFFIFTWIGDLLMTYDLVNVKKVKIPNNYDINDVDYGDGKYIFVSGDKKALITYDLKEFTVVDTPQAGLYIKYVFGKWVASSLSYVMYSLDGLTWSMANITGVSQYGIGDLCYENDKLLLGYNSASYYYQSTDGINWTKVTANITSGGAFKTFCYGGGVYLTVTVSNKINRSADLKNWEVISVNFVDTPNSVVYYRGTFYLTTNSHSIYKSDDLGKTWTLVTNAYGSDTLNIAGVIDGELVLYDKTYTNKTGPIYSTRPTKKTLDQFVREKVDDTGWINISLAGSVVAYNQDSIPQIRRMGSQVFIRGAVKGITAIGTTIAYLPIGFRPSGYHPFTCPGTEKRQNRFQIRPSDGRLQFENATSDATSFATSNWYPINTTYLAD